MSTIVSFLLVTASLIFVGWPFFRAEQEGAESPDKPEDLVSPLERQKREAYAAIREAEFDLHTGKLSQDDFAVLEEKYRRQALAAIAAIDKEQPPRRARRAAEARAAFCPDCGSRIPTKAKFCGGCGRAVSELAA